ncbi:hypothetical protein IGI57_000986 [Enterococcus sp. DIV0213j]|jgi:hypothetical protein
MIVFAESKTKSKHLILDFGKTVPQDEHSQAILEAGEARKRHYK